MKYLLHFLLEKQAQTITLNAPKKKTIGVGNNFQAPVPIRLEEDYDSPVKNRYPERKMEECLWNAHNGLPDADIFNYCCEANTHFGISSDRVKIDDKGINIPSFLGTLHSSQSWI